MTNLEIIRVVSLIVVTLLSLILGAIALVGATRKGFTTGRLQLLILSLGALFVTYISFNVDKIQPADWAQIMLTVGLVAITGSYTIATQKQAEASIKMAEEMRNSRIPSITIQLMSFDNNRISANLKNEGSGPALNLKCYLTHRKFNFTSKSSIYTTFAVEQKYTLSLPLENFDFNSWDGLAINCDYESVLGDKFRSILNFASKENKSLEIKKLNRGGRND